MMKSHRKRLGFENLESRRLLAADWTNASLALDVNASGLVSALDALIIINDLNSGGTRPLATKAPEVAGAKVDVNADGKISAIDALVVINAMIEFNQPMTLDLNLHSVQPPQSTAATLSAPVFSGVTLPRAIIRLEEVVAGVASQKSTTTADQTGLFHFQLGSGDENMLYRLVATDELGRSEQVEFTFQSDRSVNVTNGQLARHFPASIGSVAPPVVLKNQEGNQVELAQLLKESAVVLYFYPKDNTPGCSAQASDFRDRKAEIESLGAKVVGVSIDPVESHQQFAGDYNLNFDILSDVERQVSAAYGVLGEFNGAPIAKRTTFIIGKDGIIKEVFKGVNVAVHGDQVVTALRNGIAQMQ